MGNSTTPVKGVNPVSTKEKEEVAKTAAPPPVTNDPKPAAPDVAANHEAEMKAQEQHRLDEERLAQERMKNQDLLRDEQAQLERNRAALLDQSNRAVAASTDKEYTDDDINKARRRLADILNETSDYAVRGRAKLDYLFNGAYPKDTPLEHPVFGYGGIVVTYGDLKEIFED